MKWSDCRELFDRVQGCRDIVVSSVHWAKILFLYSRIDWSNEAFTVCVCLCECVSKSMWSQLYLDYKASAGSSSLWFTPLIQRFHLFKLLFSNASADLHADITLHSNKFVDILRQNQEVLLTVWWSTLGWHSSKQIQNSQADVESTVTLAPLTVLMDRAKCLHQHTNY